MADQSQAAGISEECGQSDFCTWIATILDARFNAGLGTLAPFWCAMPLRVFFRADNLTVAHVNDSVAVAGGFGVVGDHQNRLAKIPVGVAEHL
jgi:hypothetical protein